jgi:hypothetical protein
MAVRDDPRRATLTYRPWTDSDIATLIELRAEGARMREIATTLDRTEWSVIRKAQVLGLRNPHRRKSKLICQ